VTKWGVYRANWRLQGRRGVQKRDGYPHSLKTLKLIYYINLAEIVKNFTNFACGIGDGAIKFRRFIKPVRFCFARVFDEVHRFLQ